MSNKLIAQQLCLIETPPTFEQSCFSITSKLGENLWKICTICLIQNLGIHARTTPLIQVRFADISAVILLLLLSRAFVITRTKGGHGSTLSRILRFILKDGPSTLYCCATILAIFTCCWHCAGIAYFLYAVCEYKSHKQYAKGIFIDGGFRPVACEHLGYSPRLSESTGICKSASDLNDLQLLLQTAPVV